MSFEDEIKSNYEIVFALKLMDNGELKQSLSIFDDIYKKEKINKFSKKTILFLNKRYSRLLLNFGFYEMGWKYFKYNWLISYNKFKLILKKNPKLKYLDNLNLADDTSNILIWNDGGYGDFIFQMRFHSVFKKFFKNYKILKNDLTYLLIDQNDVSNEINDFDYHLPLNQIPRLLNSQIHKENNFQYSYLKNPEIISIYKDYIGLVFKTNTSKEKSLNLQNLKLLFDSFQNQKFLIIQNDLSQNEINFFQNFKNVFLLFDFDNKKFEDTFKFINSCKLIISIDTAASHFAGYLKKKCFLLLPQNNSFYWGSDTKFISFYPNHYLLRQSKRNSWDNEMVRLVKIISSKVK